MNKAKLKSAERQFFRQYPEGFMSPEMVEIGKKHKMDKHIAFAQESFSKKALKNVETTCENMVKLVSRSSMVSLFEKPKFRDAVKSMNQDEKAELVDALRLLIHDAEEEGFNALLTILTRYKLAKWTLISVFRCYYYPSEDLLFKPTTVKNVIKFFELDDLVYKPRPSYAFFVKYRSEINAMKAMCDASLSPNNASFSGFLMISME